MIYGEFPCRAHVSDREQRPLGHGGAGGHHDPVLGTGWGRQYGAPRVPEVLVFGRVMFGPKSVDSWVVLRHGLHIRPWRNPGGAGHYLAVLRNDRPETSIDGPPFPGAAWNGHLTRLGGPRFGAGRNLDITGRQEGARRGLLSVGQRRQRDQEPGDEAQTSHRTSSSLSSLVDFDYRIGHGSPDTAVGRAPAEHGTSLAA